MVVKRNAEGQSREEVERSTRRCWARVVTVDGLGEVRAWRES